MKDENQFEYSCSECNNIANATDKFCTNCGADLSEQVYENEVEYKYIPKQAELKGVGGWLLFFCIGLVFVTPLISLYNIFSTFQNLSPIAKYYPGLLPALIIDIVMAVGIIGFSIYAGINLWQVKPGAVKLAKKYLIFYVAYVIAEYVLLINVGDTPKEFTNVMYSEGISDLFKSFIYLIVWYSYLNKSQRVKNTYSEQEDSNRIESEFNEYEKVDDSSFKQFDETSQDKNETRKTYANNIEEYQEIDDSQLSELEKDRVYANFLGLNGKITKSDISKIYKELIELYHPDKVSHLGKEFQIFAEKKTKDINKAYSYFKKKYGL